MVTQQVLAQETTYTKAFFLNSGNAKSFWSFDMNNGAADAAKYMVGAEGFFWFNPSVRWEKSKHGFEIGLANIATRSHLIERFESSHDMLYWSNYSTLDIFGNWARTILDNSLGAFSLGLESGLGGGVHSLRAEDQTDFVFRSHYLRARLSPFAQYQEEISDKFFVRMTFLTELINYQWQTTNIRDVGPLEKVGESSGTNLIVGLSQSFRVSFGMKI